MNSRSNPVIVGVGTSNFGKQTLTAEELVVQAVTEAFESAGVTSADLDAVYLGTVFSQPGTAHRALRAAGITGVPIITVENACASGTLAVHLAAESVRNGTNHTVLAVGVEKMTNWIKGPIPPDPYDIDALSGMILPGLYAMSASRYAHLYGVTPEDLAWISVKNHRNAIDNPRAQYRGEYSIDEVLASKPIADPLTILQCSPISDGAGAAVIRSAERSDPGLARVEILASALESGEWWPSPTAGDDRVWNAELIERTTKRVLRESGISIADVDVLEVHDAFTIGEIVTIEAMGLCPEGEGAAFSRDGHTMRGGSIPVNPSGGLLSRGHPLGATGLAQLAELFWQLTGQAGNRQAPGASTALLETMGGSVAGLSGHGCVVAALRTL